MMQTPHVLEIKTSVNKNNVQSTPARGQMPQQSESYFMVTLILTCEGNFKTRITTGDASDSFSSQILLRLKDITRKSNVRSQK